MVEKATFLRDVPDGVWRVTIFPCLPMPSLLALAATCRTSYRLVDDIDVLLERVQDWTCLPQVQRQRWLRVVYGWAADHGVPANCISRCFFHVVDRRHVYTCGLPTSQSWGQYRSQTPAFFGVDDQAMMDKWNFPRRWTAVPVPALGNRVRSLAVSDHDCVSLETVVSQKGESFHTLRGEATKWVCKRLEHQGLVAWSGFHLCSSLLGWLEC